MLFCYVNGYKMLQVMSMFCLGDLFEFPWLHCQAVQVHCIATEPTFFGNYAPPDDLDGQIIDLVSLS